MYYLRILYLSLFYGTCKYALYIKLFYGISGTRLQLYLVITNKNIMSWSTWKKCFQINQCGNSSDQGTF